MKLVKSYTLQDWRTQETISEDIPLGIFNFTLTQMIQFLVGDEHTMTANLNFNELFAFLVFHELGWTIYRMPMNTSDWLMRIFIKERIINKFNISLEALKKDSGCPDFLLIKGKDFKFVEVKAGRDRLRLNQLAWATKFEYPLFVFRIIDANL